MIFESLPRQFNIDLQKLRDFFDQNVRPLDPKMMSKAFGGWSILSNDGDYRSGFSTARLDMGVDVLPPRQIEEKLQAAGLRSFDAYSVPTQLYFGYVKELIELWEAEGFFPRRVRFMLLKPGGASLFHTDNPPNVYAVRLHIPIFTNKLALFQLGNEQQVIASTHLPADGQASLVRVNQPHRVINLGTEDRIHLIATIHDTKKRSKFHQYERESPF